MDKALVFATKDCRFESCQGQMMLPGLGAPGPLCTVAMFVHMLRALSIDVVPNVAPGSHAHAPGHGPGGAPAPCPCAAVVLLPPANGIIGFVLLL